jgi:transposase
MRSIVRRDSGETYPEYLTDLAKASGMKTPTRAALARLDRRRKKKTSNKDWTSPTDPSAKITKMKDDRTHLTHKAEHAIDVESGALVAVTVQGADRGDTTTMKATLTEAQEQIQTLALKTSDCDLNLDGVLEVVADKGHHSTEALIALEDLGLRSYICEPDRGRRKWNDNVAAQMAVYANRRRMRGGRGIRLRELRGDRIERPFAHLYETGAMRRTHLRGHTNILKRLLIHGSAFNLGLMMRNIYGTGKPRVLRYAVSALLTLSVRRKSAIWADIKRLLALYRCLSSPCFSS